MLLYGVWFGAFIARMLLAGYELNQITALELKTLECSMGPQWLDRLSLLVLQNELRPFIYGNTSPK